MCVHGQHNDNIMNNFSKIKSTKLLTVDLSKKGSIDDPIKHVIEFINSQDEFVTTSSCSGRIIVVSQSKVSENEVSNIKKGCNWIFTSHSIVEPLDLIKAVLSEFQNSVFKFEPFILHVQCQRLEDAQKLHFAAVESGFRNSGITVGKKGKVIMAVRSTHGLEVPLATENQLLVSEEYLHFLVKIANEKMMENEKRIQKFYEQIHLQYPDKSS